MGQAEKRQHIIPYQTLVRIWLTLLLLTAILVATSRLYHEALSVWAMLTLTPLKAGLIFFFFMHLKYEKPFLKGLVFLTVGFLTLSIGLMFFDISYR